MYFCKIYNITIYPKAIIIVCIYTSLSAYIFTIPRYLPIIQGQQTTEIIASLIKPMYLNHKFN